MRNTLVHLAFKIPKYCLAEMFFLTINIYDLGLAGFDRAHSEMGGSTWGLC